MGRMGAASLAPSWSSMAGSQSTASEAALRPPIVEAVEAQEETPRRPIGMQRCGS
jgi:hypothetical protein